METKKCRKCGDVKNVTSFYKIGKYYSSYCKICYKEYNKNNSEKIVKAAKIWFENNPEKRKLSLHKYYKKNIEKINKYATEWKNNNPEKIKFITRKHQFNLINNLGDSYIKAKLKSKGFTSEQINENNELIEIQRLIIKTKRLCRTSQN